MSVKVFLVNIRQNLEIISVGELDSVLWYELCYLSHIAVVLQSRSRTLILNWFNLWIQSGARFLRQKKLAEIPKE